MALAQRKTHVFMSNVATGSTVVGSPTVVDGYSVVGFQIVGLNTGTIQFEATLAMEPSTTTWVAVRAIDANAGSGATTATADGLYTLDVRGFTAVRPRALTLSIVNNGRLDVFGLLQAETT
jgi:hypothetical protein